MPFTPEHKSLLAIMLAVPLAASAQQPKSGGTFGIYQRDNPASASIHEVATFSTNVPFMAIFNNLIIYKQDEPRNTEDSIVPELATAWTWSDDRLALTFKLWDSVAWHDGKPFASARSPASHGIRALRMWCRTACSRLRST